MGVAGRGTSRPGGRSWKVNLGILAALSALAIGGLVLSASLSSSRHVDQPGLQASAFPGTDPGDGDTAGGGQGNAVDGIRCDRAEQLQFHKHAHLFILKDGVAQPISANVGIPGGALLPRCFYWMHTHDRTGLIHLEAPSQRSFTLGQFFDTWGWPLTATRVVKLDVPGGQLTTYVDGREFHGDPRAVEVTAHTQVVLEVGRRVPPPSFDFQGN